MCSNVFVRLSFAALLVCGPIVGAAERPAYAKQHSPPNVVVSIKPLHSLVAGVMGETGEPVLLIEAAASPHTYTLRPSQARMLDAADLVVWIGPGLERFLQRPLKALSEDAEQLRADTLTDVRLLPARSGGVWKSHDHDRPGATTKPEGHEDEVAFAGYDPHLWLDPGNAMAIVSAVADRLAALDPNNANLYRTNAHAYRKRLKSLDGSLEARLGKVSGKPYLVFHDAYQYFEAHYDLNALGAISVSPGRSPGVRRIMEIQERIRSTGAWCLFAEPQFSPALVDSLAKDVGVRAEILDPLGVDIPPGPDAYPLILENLAKDLADCLSAAS